MTELGVGFVGGAGLGLLYFGALWVTVRRIPTARRPGVLVLGSYLVRLVLLGAGLYGLLRLVGGGAVVAAVLGILAARWILVRRFGTAAVVGTAAPGDEATTAAPSR